MNDITTTAPRLPVPAGFNLDEWIVLTEAIFPNAKEVRSILLAVKYCAQRKLDILKRPVNIVPIWNSQLGKNVEGIWPSITEVETTAARSKEWAGMDEPKFGPMITEKFKGRKEDKRQGWIDVEIEVTYPESCSVTVYRKVGGERCPFTEPVFWKEAYGRYRGGMLPNDMWTKRPKGQLIKVAKAFSLRAAFPEEGSGPTAEEIEGQVIEPMPAPPAPTDNWTPPQQEPPPPSSMPIGAPMTDGGTAPMTDKHGGEPAETIDPETGEILDNAPRTLDRTNEETWREWCSRLLACIRREIEMSVLEKWIEKNKKNLEALVKEAPKMHAQLQAAVGRERSRIHERELLNTSDEQESNNAMES